MQVQQNVTKIEGGIEALIQLARKPPEFLSDKLINQMVDNATRELDNMS